MDAATDTGALPGSHGWLMPRAILVPIIVTEAFPGVPKPTDDCSD